MKFTLRDYQDDAVRDVLRQLDKARDAFHGRYATRSAFSLTATTGAGKTVMAAAAIEALFHGNADYGFEADPGAVVLWFTDDPSLNEQTRFRIMQASDLAFHQLVTIEPTFTAEKLSPGRVYFLNQQKLSRNALLVRAATDDGQGLPGMSPPDLRANTIWDILANTIADERLTLYLVLDEAHRGMKTPTAAQRNERGTVVRRLINGEAGAPPIPIVWGISATVDRFEEAMEQTKDRDKLASVVIDPARVQASGLIKDDIRLDFPAEAGQFDTVLLTRAVNRVRQAGQEWADYAASQTPPEDPVLPLLVVQVPNTPDDELLLTAFQAVRDAWPELADDAMAHVFGEHRTISLGSFTVPHISPEKVQDSTWVRVLFAKDAISTGWDCPRAEVLMSFRPAQDRTAITQLLGRMVRTPLARRIEGNDRLNSVECLLPRFNRETAVSVGEEIMGRGSGGGPGPGPRVVPNPVDLVANPAIAESVWTAFDAMPSQTLPRTTTRPVRRLMALATALSQDGLRTGARRAAKEALCNRLNGLLAEHAAFVEATVDDLWEMSGETAVVGVSGDAAGSRYTMSTYTEVSDERSIRSDFRAAERAFTPDIAKEYAGLLAAGGDLIDAYARVAALARVEGAAAALDQAADALATDWFATHRVAVKTLSGARQEVYHQIVAMARAPERIDVIRPSVRIASAAPIDGPAYPAAEKHLLSDASGLCPLDDLNGWERDVVGSELARGDTVAWYRNPSRASADSLCIAYADNSGEWRRMCPDFVFFSQTSTGVRANLVDPHGTFLGDALPKLRGLAAYAEQFGDSFHRIEAVASVDGQLRVLDLTRPAVRAGILAAESAEALYSSAPAYV